MNQAQSKSIKATPVKVPTDTAAVQRVRTVVERQHGGQVPKDSYLHRMERVVQQRPAQPAPVKPRPESTPRPADPPVAQDMLRSRQLNPNNDAFWRSRGESGRPDDWQQRLRDTQKA